MLWSAIPLALCLHDSEGVPGIGRMELFVPQFSNFRDNKNL